MDIQFAIIFGFAIVAGIIVASIVFKATSTDKKALPKYDERQKALRGKSFMFGFYGMAIANAILMFMHLFGLGNFLGCYGYFASVIVGIIVQMTYAIFKDAYLGLNTNAHKYIIFMTIISLINIVAAVSGIASGEMFKDGVLHSSFLNLLCSILFAVLVIDLSIKKLIDKKEA